jgi:hypothetical protein
MIIPEHRPIKDAGSCLIERKGQILMMISLKQAKASNMF